MEKIYVVEMYLIKFIIKLILLNHLQLLMFTMIIVTDFLMIVFTEVDQIEMLIDANQLMRYRLNREKLEARNIGAFYLIMRITDTGRIRFYRLHLIVSQSVQHGYKLSSY